MRLTFKRDLADFCNFQSVLKSLVKHVAYEDLTFLGISFKTGSGVDCVADGGKVHSEVTAYVSYDCRTAVNAYAEADEYAYTEADEHADPGADGYADSRADGYADPRADRYPHA